MSVLVTWGQSLGPPGAPPILKPSCVSRLSGQDIVQIECGTRHNLFLTSDGTVYANGSNSLSQLGVRRGDSSDSFVPQPTPVTALETKVIRMVACGEDFSLAVNDDGQLYSWGKNSHGQTAQDRSQDENFTNIKLVRSLSSHRIEGIACGLRHALAFTASSRVFSWGCNNFGELGLSRSDLSLASLPQEVTALQLLPVRSVSAGGSHSFCLSVSGVLFGWGRNSEGQLGLGHDEHQPGPVELASLRRRRVAHVACGDRHTAVRTEDGAVFTFGCGGSGQLGHGRTRGRILLPMQVQELMGSRVSQVACGRAHTLAVVVADGVIFAFGSGAHGQLGLDHCEDKDSPAVVPNLWSTADCSARPQLHWLACGGHASFALGRPCDKLAPPPGRPELESREMPISTLDFDLLDSPRCSRLARLKAALSSPACLVASCLDEPHGDPRPDASGLNLDVAIRLTDCLLASLSDDDEDEEVVQTCLSQLASKLEQSAAVPRDVECLRAAFLLPLTAFCEQLRFAPFHCRVARYFVRVVDASPFSHHILVSWFSALRASLFNRVVQSLKETVCFIYAMPPGDFSDRQDSLHALVKVLSFFHSINSRKTGHTIVPAEAFYMPGVTDHIDIRQHLSTWMTSPNAFHLCKFLFLFDGNAKSKLLSEFARLEMHSNAIRTPNDLPCTRLSVRRRFLIDDTLDALEKMKPVDFKKKLRVFFVGEDGIDDGGVRKEFFLILFRDILDPKYGMFKLDEESRMLWFQASPFETDDKYLMIGRLLGLAIYNSILVPHNFPLALFKKLLDCPVSLEDLHELYPTIGRSLQAVMSFDGEPDENIFELYFEITESLLGETPRSVDLMPNGGNIPVTSSNRERYVQHYVDHVFNRSCQRQFEALKSGFYQVCGQYLCMLFQACPTELLNVVRGSEEYDWELLQHNAVYSGCFDSEHKVVRWFWKVFLLEMSDQERKQFLLFVTGSDRVPVVGMRGIRLELSSLLRKSDQYFPVAHTCFSILELPLYSSKAILKRQILSAIQHSEGFGLE